MTTEPTLIPPAEKQALDRENNELLAYAREFKVTDSESFRVGASFVIRCATAIKAVKEKLAPIRDSTTRAWKAATNLESELVTPPTTARSMMDRKLVDWSNAEKRRQAAEEEQARAAAAKKADEDRQRLALQAEELGDSETAQRILERAGEAPVGAVVPVQAVPVVEGFGTRENWKVREKPNGTDALIEAAYANRALRIYLLPDVVALGKLARAQKQTFDVPGWEAFDSGSTTVKTK